jgi:hypothetical protein
MTALVPCTGCGQPLRVTPSARTRAVKCPGCGAPFVPPSEDVLAAALALAESRKTVAENVSAEQITSTSSLETETVAPEPLAEATELTGESPTSTRRRVWPLVAAVLLFGIVTAAAIGVALWWSGDGLNNVTWQEFKAPNEIARLEMPGKPSPRMAVAPEGARNALNYVVELDRPRARFAFSCYDCNAEEMVRSPFPERAAAARDQRLRTTRGRVVHEAEVTAEGQPGREYQIETADGDVLIERMFLARQGRVWRVFVLSAVGPTLRPDKGAVARFFNSFRFPVIASPANLPGRFPTPLSGPGDQPQLGEVVTLPVEAGNVRSLDFTPDGRELCASGGRTPLTVWNVARWQEIDWHGAQPGPARALAFSADGKWLATAIGAAVTLREGATARPVADLSGDDDRDPIRCLAFTTDGGTLAAGAGSTVRLFDVAARKEQPALTFPSQILALAFAPQRKTLAIGLADQTVRLWNVPSGEEQGRLEGHAGPITAVAFSPEGRILASASSDRTVRLWAGAGRPDGKPLGSLLASLEGHAAPVSAVVFGPEQGLLVSADEAGTINLWDARSVRRRTAFRATADKAPILALAISSAEGGKYLASAAGNRVTVWNLNQLLQPPGPAVIGSMKPGIGMKPGTGPP